MVDPRKRRGEIQGHHGQKGEGFTRRDLIRLRTDAPFRLEKERDPVLRVERGVIERLKPHEVSLEGGAPAEVSRELVRAIKEGVSEPVIANPRSGIVFFFGRNAGGNVVLQKILRVDRNALDSELKKH